MPQSEAILTLGQLTRSFGHASIRTMLSRFVLLLSLLSSACSGSLEPNPLRGIQAAERRVRADPQAIADLPPALINGNPVAWDELRPELAEAAGSVILEELALTRLLRAEVAALGLSIGPDDIARERQYLMQSMRDAGFISDAEQSAAFRRVFASRGLGDRRLQALLERNAMLRAVAGRSVLVSSEEVQEAFDVTYGPRLELRIIVTDDLVSASNAIDCLSDLWWIDAEAFGREARRTSVDPSAVNGGRIEPISLADSRYPAALRSAARILAPGQMSQVFSLEGRYAIVFLERSIPGAEVTLDEVREQCEALVRRRQERQSMELLADQLLRSASIEVTDPSLRWSWETRTESQ